MRKASFKVTNAGSNSTAHNSRTNPPKYLIEDIGYNDNYYDLKYSDEEYLKLSELKYLSKNNQKMQERQKVALIKETVLNLKDHHTEKDVEKLFKKLNEKYGGHKITELSIHRDEGHFEKDGIAYYPTKHILQKDGDWYIVPLDKFLDDDFKPTKNDFSEKVKIDDFQKIKNYHAHVKFSMFDLGTGITGRMTKGQVSERLKVVSKELGLAYKPKEKINSGKAINHIKDQHDLNRRSQIKQLFLNKKLNKQTAKKEELKVTTKELKATTKDLQSEIKTLRKDLSGQGLNKEDFKKVNELNKELKVQIENKKIDVNTLEIRLKKLKEELLQKDKLVNSITTNSPIENALLSASSKDDGIKKVVKTFIKKDEKIQKQEKELINDHETILELKASNESLKSLLSVSKQSMNDLKVKFEELEKDFNNKLEKKIAEYKKEKEEPAGASEEFLEMAAKVAKRNHKNQEQIK